MTYLAFWLQIIPLLIVIAACLHLLIFMPFYALRAAWRAGAPMTSHHNHTKAD